MRLVETLLLLANLLTFFVLAVPLPSAVRWMRYWAPIALVIAVAQVLVEGPRWQMVPAYALTGLFLLVWLLRNTLPLHNPVRQILNHRVAVGLAVVLSLFGLVSSIALPIVLPVFRFPPPGGPYAIGTLTYQWVDVDRPEIFSADPNDRRELMVQIWYPAKAACRLEPRLRACLLMDARMPTDVVQDGLQQPTMWITRDAKTMQLEGWPQMEIDEHQGTMRAAFESLRGDGYFVQVPGMFHVNLTDIPYWSPLFSRLGFTGPIDGPRAHSIINAYSLAFFDRHLKGQPGVLLNGPTGQYPEVLFEQRLP